MGASREQYMEALKAEALREEFKERQEREKEYATWHDAL